MNKKKKDPVPEEYSDWDSPEVRSAIKLVAIIFGVTLLFGLGLVLYDYVMDMTEKPTAQPKRPNGLDPSRPAHEIEYFDYNTNTVYYRDRSNYNSGSTNSGSTKKTSTPVYTYPNPTIDNNSLPSNQRKKIQEFNSKTPSQRDKIIREIKALPPSEREEIIYELMGSTDYNDLLDYYGDPELQ